MSTNIVIIGCGNIGSRLLQSLAQAPSPGMQIFAVEPSAAARELSAQRFAQVQTNNSVLHMAANMEDLPLEAALLIISTSAHHRFALLEAALDKTTPATVFLEKTLFTRISAYVKAKARLGNIPTYVNTTRSVWPGYADLRAKLDANTPVTIDVAGTDWSLGSNGIHFLALGEYLANSQVSKVSLSSPILRDSKRAGYQDLTGEVHATHADGSVTKLASHPLKSDAHGPDTHVLVTQGDRSWDIDEIAVTIDGTPFSALRASDLGTIFANIIAGRAVALPLYAQSAELHLKFLRLLQPVLGAADDDVCMVT